MPLGSIQDRKRTGRGRHGPGTSGRGYSPGTSQDPIREFLPERLGQIPKVVTGYLLQTGVNIYFRADTQWFYVCRRTLRMSDAEHIKAFRLFDLVLDVGAGRGFQATDWEKEHLRGCEECRGLQTFFRHQITERPLLYSNGEVSPTDAWYRNICCDLELFVPAGKKFPDCRRHKNLPTSWKRVEPAKKQSA